MKNILFILIFLAIPLNAFSDGDLSRKAEAIKTAYLNLKQNCNKKNQDEYIKFFPKTEEEFREMFYYKNDRYGELYSVGEDCVFTLRCIIKDQPNKILPILLKITKTIPHGFDSITALRIVILEACSYENSTFISVLRTFDKMDIIKIVNFLADEELIQHNKKYNECIKILKKNRANDLAEIFIRERENRMKQPHK